jgi:hypothetical protein
LVKPSSLAAASYVKGAVAAGAVITVMETVDPRAPAPEVKAADPVETFSAAVDAATATPAAKAEKPMKKARRKT